MNSSDDGGAGGRGIPGPAQARRPRATFGEGMDPATRMLRDWAEHAIVRTMITCPNRPMPQARCVSSTPCLRHRAHAADVCARPPGAKDTTIRGAVSRTGPSPGIRGGMDARLRRIARTSTSRRPPPGINQAAQARLWRYRVGSSTPLVVTAGCTTGLQPEGPHPRATAYPAAPKPRPFPPHPNNGLIITERPVQRQAQKAADKIRIVKPSIARRPHLLTTPHDHCYITRHLICHCSAGTDHSRTS